MNKILHFLLLCKSKTRIYGAKSQNPRLLTAEKTGIWGTQIFWESSLKSMHELYMENVRDILGWYPDISLLCIEEFDPWPYLLLYHLTENTYLHLTQLMRTVLWLTFPFFPGTFHFLVIRPVCLCIFIGFVWPNSCRTLINTLCHQHTKIIEILPQTFLTKKVIYNYIPVQGPEHNLTVYSLNNVRRLLLVVDLR